MTCERCGAPLRTDSDRGLFVCDYCGGEVVPPAEDDGVLILDETKFGCPVCAAKLVNGSLEQIPMLYCRACHGMFIAMDDLGPLVTSRRAHLNGPATFIEPRSSSDAERQLRCPRCGVAMDGHAYGGGGNVNVDSCEPCASVWLDKGELRKIAAAPDYQPPAVQTGVAPE